MFGSKKKVIAAQTKAISELHSRLEAAENEKLRIMEEFRGKEDALTRVLTEASLTARKIVDDANEQAVLIVARAEESLQQSNKQSEILLETAYQNARDIVKEAETKQGETLAETERAVRDYADLLAQYNGVMKENAAQAEAFSRQYAEMLHKMMNAVPLLTDALAPSPGDPELRIPDSVEAGPYAAPEAEPAAYAEPGPAAAAPEAYVGSEEAEMVLPDASALPVEYDMSIEQMQEALKELGIELPMFDFTEEEDAERETSDHGAVAAGGFEQTVADDETDEADTPVWKVSDVAPEDGAELQIDAIINAVVNRNDDDD